jgi:hypothetical protein
MQGDQIMKFFTSIAICVAISLTPGAAFAEYTCAGTFLKSAGDYAKNDQTTIYDYYYRNGALVYGVPKIGYVDAKSIRLDKSCVLERLERRLDLETVR